MAARISIERIIAAPAADVISAAREPVMLGFADPKDPQVDRESITWVGTDDFVEDVVWRGDLSSQDGGTKLVLSVTQQEKVPYFSWLISPLVRRALRKRLELFADSIAARAVGKTAAGRPSRPVWAPPDRMSGVQTRTIATVCAVLAITSYGGSLFTQAAHYVARTFEAHDASLSFALAATRAGTLAAVLGSVLADRRGRRRVLIFSTIALSLVNLASAFSTSLPMFTVLQVFSRGFVNLAAVVGFIVIIEEAPEGARAYMLAVSTVAAASGFALGSLLLPIADLSAEAWRVLFALTGAGLLIVPGIASRLPETRRFTGLGSRIRSAKVREVIDRTYGGRFAVVAVTGFMINLLAAPGSQLMNRYLAETHGYSAAGILVLRFLTQGVPALIAVWIGGRLAESNGRKPIAIRGTIVMAITTAAFFVTGGPVLWVMLLLSSTAGAISGPSLAAFNTELFPTEVRGTAGAGLLAAGVAGSVAGLVVAGLLAEPFGSLGPAIAVTAVGPLLAGMFLIRRLPEAMGRPLDEISPPEV